MPPAASSVATTNYSVSDGSTNLRAAAVLRPDLEINHLYIFRSSPNNFRPVVFELYATAFSLG